MTWLIQGPRQGRGEKGVGMGPDTAASGEEEGVEGGSAEPPGGSRAETRGKGGGANVQGGGGVGWGEYKSPRTIFVHGVVHLHINLGPW